MVGHGRNPPFGRDSLDPDVTRSSNDLGSHEASIRTPVHHAEWSAPTASGYRISNHMVGQPNATTYYTPSPFRIIMIGAGAAGIDFLHHSFTERYLLDLPGGEDIQVQVYDKNPSVGGTWYENRYPGCACDVPSASYSFSWRPNPHWTRYYSPAKEIYEYFKGIVDEEGLMKWITLSTEIVGAEWDEAKSVWKVRLRKTDGEGKGEEWDDECNVLLNGTGFVNKWKWPKIEGIESFKGDMFHTANYDSSYDMKGKRAAVIGSGSSGVQTLAAIYPEVSHVYHWVRNATWVTAGFGQKFAGPGGSNFDYSEEQKAEWSRDPEKYRAYRKMVEQELNQRFKLVLRNSHESDEANAFAYHEMKTKMGGNTRLMDAIIPKDFNVGCRRPTPGNGYLEALIGDKSTVFTEEIECIKPHSIVTSSGAEVEVDVIICATGFDTSYRPKFPLIGLDGIPLAEKWKDTPESYISVAAHNVPNFFLYSGPWSPVAQGSILPLLTAFTKHFIQIVKKMRKQHIRRISPKQSAIDDYLEHSQKYLTRTCWADPCTSWFKQGKKDGPVVMWPGSRLAFMDLLEEVNWEDYHVEYWSKNRWGWLGSGFHRIEFDDSADITYYLDGKQNIEGEI
ncbi:FAD/NAD(P)-binding domain-containing protein [Rhizodiscina lignyota]|uniref:FAD/NAD(P)-binding domain-containing protein n=1 Tax=Rhizodiscina lignyota TaxID=1504668 RepID=A0A9P4IFJ6_9PEZI|nr:FAD/NAD(P)-binding domain-containing protein [Rhizodiscina lignyota]